jgi:hypothetical protein
MHGKIKHVPNSKPPTRMGLNVMMNGGAPVLFCG